MTEEKVHGGVEFGVDPDDQDHACVAQHSDCVDGEEEQEHGHLELWVFWEAQEDECHSSSLVFLGSVDTMGKLIQRRK